QPRPAQVLFEWLRLVEHAATPVHAAVELDVAIDDLRVRTRIHHHVGPASEYLLALTEQPRDQAVELLAAVSAREHFVHRCGETRRIAHRLRAGREGPVLELAVRNQTGELEQTAPHEASRAGEVEQCVLREHGPAPAL